MIEKVPFVCTLIRIDMSAVSSHGCTKERVWGKEERRRKNANAANKKNGESSVRALRAW